MQRIPMMLIYFRMVAGVAILFLAYLKPPIYREWIVALLTLGLLSDIFDGIIARRLQVSTPAMRRMDSSADQFFFIAVAVASIILCPDFYRANFTMLAVLLASEALIYVVSFAKFRKEVATHSIGAKIWTLILFATLIQIIWQCESQILFAICVWLGVITRMEIIAIILTLKFWASDVPTVYHAYQLRQGKEIKRHRWFNG